jgi:hypothetical protein
MAITWSSVEHCIASGFHDILVGSRAVAAHNAQIQAVGAQVEAVTAQVGIFYPPAIGALEIERVSLACFGAVAGLIMAHGSAAQAAAAHPEADPILLNQVEALMQQHPQYVIQAAQLFGLETPKALLQLPAPPQAATQPKP